MTAVSYRENKRSAMSNLNCYQTYEICSCLCCKPKYHRISPEPDVESPCRIITESIPSLLCSSPTASLPPISPSGSLLPCPPLTLSLLCLPLLLPSLSSSPTAAVHYLLCVSLSLLPSHSLSPLSPLLLPSCPPPHPPSFSSPSPSPLFPPLPPPLPPSHP